MAERIPYGLLDGKPLAECKKIIKWWDEYQANRISEVEFDPDVYRKTLEEEYEKKKLEREMKEHYDAENELEFDLDMYRKTLEEEYEKKQIELEIKTHYDAFDPDVYRKTLEEEYKKKQIEYEIITSYEKENPEMFDEERKRLDEERQKLKEDRLKLETKTLAEEKTRFKKEKKFDEKNNYTFEIKRSSVPSANDYIKMSGTTEDPDEAFNYSEQAVSQLKGTTKPLINYNVMTPQEFEDWIIELLHAVKNQQTDGGFDGILPDGRALEIKAGESVGVDVIQKFKKDMDIKEINKGLLVYRRRITSGARIRSQEHNIETRKVSDLL